MRRAFPELIDFCQQLETFCVSHQWEMVNLCCQMGTVELSMFANPQDRKIPEILTWDRILKST